MYYITETGQQKNWGQKGKNIQLIDSNQLNMKRCHEDITNQQVQGSLSSIKCYHMKCGFKTADNSYDTRVIVSARERQRERLSLGVLYDSHSNEHGSL